MIFKIASLPCNSRNFANIRITLRCLKSGILLLAHICFASKVTYLSEQAQSIRDL